MTSQEMLANLLSLNTGAIQMTLKDIGHGQAIHSPHETCNSAAFILGHIVTYRYQIAKMLGMDESHSLGKTFEWGASDENRQQYPPLAELHAEMEAMGEKITQRLKSISAEELAAEADYEVPPMPKTVEGAVSFLVFHETYHVGQLGYLRRFNGQERAFG